MGEEQDFKRLEGALKEIFGVPIFHAVLHCVNGSTNLAEAVRGMDEFAKPTPQETQAEAGTPVPGFNHADAILEAERIADIRIGRYHKQYQG